MRQATKSERGQATVELAIAIPLLVLLFMLLVQIGIVMFDQLAVSQAAREAARAAAVDPDPRSTASAARRATRLNVNDLKVETDNGRADGLVSVTVSYPVTIRLPISNSVLYASSVSSRAVIRAETN